MKKFLMFTITCLFVTVSAFAQTKTITGKVIGSDDNSGVPASVQIQGTSRGASANIDGDYSITVEKGQTLVFSAIGYTTQEIVVGDANVINVTLQVDATILSEAVVTAMGIKRERKALAYSVQDLGSAKITENKTANPLNSLQGKVAGVNITQSSGAAGAGAHIVLRGGTSLERDNQPLFVVDGIIYDNSTSSIGNTAFDGMQSVATSNSNRIMDISPEDIENMSILKGAAASALYGARAANGVIMITTKKGQDGAISVDFSSKYSTVWANRLPEQQSKWGRGVLTTDGSLNASSTTYSSWGERINGKVYNNIDDFFQTGSTWDNSLSISTGNKNGTTYLSANRFDQTGIVPGTGYDKTTFRVNTEQKYGKFTISGSAAYSQANTQKTLTSAGLWGAGGNGTMSAVYRWARNDDMKHYLNDDGTKYRIYPNTLLGQLVENPYWIINKNKMTDHTDRFTGNVNVDFKITDWWNVSYRLGLDRYTTGNYNLLAPGGEYTKSGYAQGMLSENDKEYQYLSTNLMTNLHKTFGDFDLGLLLGLAEEETKMEYNYRMGTVFITEDLFSFSTLVDTNKKFAQSHSKDRLRGLYGEFRASWKNMVYLTITARNDKTSTLYSPREGDKNASYWYPSVGASFLFSELLPKNDIVSFGKLRASWASVGKGASAYVTDTDLWPFQEFLGGINGTSNYWFRGNPYLRPEITETFELGLEMRFLNGRIGFDYTYYTGKSYDQILNPRTSQAPGYIFNLANVGEVYNKGMELAITGRPIQTKDFTWETVLNIAGNRGTVGTIHTSLPVLYVTDVQVGNAKAASFENGNFMGISGSKWGRTDDGKVILDQNGMPTYAAGGSTTLSVGNREPKFYGGFSNTFSYKGWSFSFLLDYRVGGDVYNGTGYWLTTTGMSKQTENRESLTIKGVVNNGTAANPDYEDKTFTFNANESYLINSVPQSGKYIIQQYWSDYYIRESANFMTKTNWLRLRSVSLSYRLPDNILNKIKYIKGCVLTVTGNNLFLLTNYKGLDPEASVAGSGIIGSSSVGFEYVSVPATAGMSFGINLKF